MANLASHLDGARPGQWEDALAEFNREAGTAFTLADFQGIYSGQDHNIWVRKVLAAPHAKRLYDITWAELVELVRRVMADDGEEHEVDFWLRMLELNIPDPRISDLTFWPEEYFGGKDPLGQLSPAPIVDFALAARWRAAPG